jgi:hypothetical protein
LLFLCPPGFEYCSEGTHIGFDSENVQSKVFSGMWGHLPRDLTPSGLNAVGM